MDKIYRSFGRPHGDMTDVRIDPPVGEAWADAAKFSDCKRQAFSRFFVARGGFEDAVDIGSGVENCLFHRFDVASGGRYVLTLKSGAKNNVLSKWRIRRPGLKVDVEFGNWSDANQDASTGNVLSDWVRADGKPVTYAYRFGGGKPIWRNTKTRHLWWRSIGITIYWWVKKWTR